MFLSSWTPNELYYILSGEGTLKLGGELIGPRDTGNNTFISEELEKSITHKVKSGDVVSIPKDECHQMITDSEIYWLIIKLY